MLDQASNDPFTRLYNEIIRQLNKRRLTVISFDSTRKPLKDQLTTADYPELQLRPQDKIVTLGSTSSTTDLERTYELGVLTGDQRLGLADVGLFHIEWRILKALHALKYGALDHLELDGRRYVDDVTVRSSNEGMADPTSGRGIVGWSALWYVTVRMSFTRGDLEDETNG